jgi:predicted NACHT family NTPase
LLPSILAELEGLVDRADDDKASVLVAETAQLRRILKQHQRVAILGAPGAGKTTLLQYVALAYAREKAGDRKLCQHGTLRKRLGTKQWRLPLLIPLVSIAGPLTKPREDGTDRSVLDVLSGILPPDLQGEPVALKYFSKQLDAGNCIVLLDGLDEVATETEFRAVVRAIESMAVKYGNNQFLLTSREAGWRGGVGADFSIFYVNDLTGTQAEAFIDSWYGAVERNAVVGRLEDEGHAERKERQRRATHRASELKSALKENIGIRRLATNPMLLSIIALVHRSLATLPKERAKLYSECAKILLEQWDISRGVRVDDTNLKLEQKESLMRRLAMAFHNGEIGERGGSREAPRQDVERILQDQLPALGRTKWNHYRATTRGSIFFAPDVSGVFRSAISGLRESSGVHRVLAKPDAHAVGLVARGDPSVCRTGAG